MGKRIASERHHVTQPQQTDSSELAPPSSDRSARKRKRAAAKSSPKGEKCQRPDSGDSTAASTHNYDWHENDDEDSSSSGSAHDALLQTPQTQHQRGQYPVNSRASLLSLATFASGGHSDYNNSNATESPRPVYTLRPSVVNGTILRDVLSKAWRLGRPIGKGNFGEIFLASDDTVCPVSSESAKYVVKIEPHSNGPLFVEIHCLINTNQTQEISNESDENRNVEPALPSRLSNGPPSGIPSYIASGTHFFGDARYRFLVLPRYDRDLHSLIKNARVAQKSLLVLAIHVINVLEHLHDKGYCHNDIKAQNLMISKCKYLKRQAKNYDMDHYEEKQQTTDSGNSSEQETNDDDYFIKNENKYAVKRIPMIKDDNYAEDEDEDFDDGATTNSNNSNSLDIYQTPVNKKHPQRPRSNAVEFSGSNPMRSCRRNDSRNSSSMYEEMVKSHYLRPSKRVSYSEFFNEDDQPMKQETNREKSPASSDNDWEAHPSRRSGTANKRMTRSKAACSTRSTRLHLRQKQQQEQLQQRQIKCESNGSVRSKRSSYQMMPVEEEHIFLIDFGLASKYQDRGVHRPFIMDQRRAHDGTLEFTSRDAHLGAHSRRSDLECLGYNLLYWSEGYLPWKEVAQQQQPEKVHRAKELFMTDVCEMLRQFYGKLVPKYLGEFLQQIGQLAYQERPNYERYRNIFKREYRRLGYDCSQITLSSEEIVRTRIPINKDEIDGGAKYDIFEQNNKIACNIMRSTFSTPFQEHSLTNRVSPKNLRSKSDKKSIKKKKFSWAEVLSQDPDQIARERAVKEFEREEVICPLQSRLPRRYEGKPTYAILAVEQSRRDKGLTVQEHNNTEEAAVEQVKGLINRAEVQKEVQDDDDEGEDEEEDAEEDENENEETDDDDNSNNIISQNDAVDSEMVEEQCDGTAILEVVPRNRGRPRGSTKKQQLAKSKSSRTRSVKQQTSSKASKYAQQQNSSQHGQNQNQRLTAIPLTTVGSNKRGCATRKDNTHTLASATGEVEHTKLKAGRVADVVDMDKPIQRRPRRCLYKTEHQMRGEPHVDVENNSNYAASMQQTVYRAWHYDDENSYGKGRSVNTSRHCRK